MAAALPFLRPLPLPRASFIQSFLRRVSTTPQADQEGQLPQSLDPHPHPSNSYPAPNTNPTAAPQAIPPALPYHVRRTPSNQLPVYQITKGTGGTSKLTRLRKIDGDLAQLRSDLQQALQLKDEQIVINQLTRQITINVGPAIFH